MNKTILLSLVLMVTAGVANAADPNPLVGWWKFYETSGTIAHDSALGNRGYVHGALWTTGQIDGALRMRCWVAVARNSKGSFS